MFKSKKDVDAHVRDVFSKCKSENEVNEHHKYAESLKIKGN